MFGYGNFDLAIGTLEKAIAGKQYIAADRFTAADLFVGANVNFMLAFNLLDPRPAFVDYARRMTDRPAYHRAKEIDGKLIAEIQAAPAAAGLTSRPGSTDTALAARPRLARPPARHRSAVGHAPAVVRRIDFHHCRAARPPRRSP